MWFQTEQMLKGGAQSSHCHFHVRKADPNSRLELQARPGDLIWNDRAWRHSSEPPYTPLHTRLEECFDKVSTFYWLWPKPFLSTKLKKQTKKYKVFHVADAPSTTIISSQELGTWLMVALPERTKDDTSLWPMNITETKPLEATSCMQQRLHRDLPVTLAFITNT